MYSVVQDAFPRTLIESARAEWPAPDWDHWHVYNDANQRKRATKDESRIPPACRLLINEMAKMQHPLLPAGAFPDLNLHGAGLHEMSDGGFLKRHLDSDSHPIKKNWRRVASGVLCLDDDFEGGAFHLNTPESTTRQGGVVEIKAKANQLVLFLSSPTSWHWVEQVSRGQRRTLALFWWRIASGPTERERAHFESAERPDDLLCPMIGGTFTPHAENQAICSICSEHRDFHMTRLAYEQRKAK